HLGGLRFCERFFGDRYFGKGIAPRTRRNIEFATDDSRSANRTMRTSYIRWLAIAAIIVGTVGVFFLGLLAIMFAMVLFGLSLIGLAATVSGPTPTPGDRKSTRLNSSHDQISYAVF